MKDTGIEVKSYKLKALPATSISNAVLFIKADSDTEATPYVTDMNGVPHPLKGSGGIKTITNTDGTIIITGTDNKVINLSDSIKSVISSALQPGSNISDLLNDVGYITIADIPPFIPSDYDLDDFTNTSLDPFVRQSEITSGITNLGYIPSPTAGTVTSDTGTNATILLADTTNSGLLSPTDKTKLNNVSNINSGDQTTIVGITGTKTEYNDSLSDGDFLFVGDVNTYTNEEAQDAIGTILLDTSTIDLIYDDSTPSISATVKANSITPSELADNIPLTEFVNDAGFEDTAQLNVRDDANRNRANHTGTQAISTVVNLQIDLDSKENATNKTTDFSVVNNTLYPSVQATKTYIDSKVPTDYSKIVYVNALNPTTATIFDLNNPPTVNDNSLKIDVNNLYIGTDASTWVYITSPAGYITKPITAVTSNFYLAGTTIDSGGNKTSAIERTGTVGGATGTANNHFITKLQLDKRKSELSYACSDEISDLTVGTLITFRMPIGLTLTNVKLSLNTAPTGSKIIVDIKKNGTTIFSTLSTVDIGTTTSVGASIPAVISDNNLVDDSIMTILTTQVGSSSAGRGLKVTLIGNRI